MTSPRLGASCLTDAGGNFLLPLSVTGPQIVLIDGSALNTGTVFYPTVPVTVTIQPAVVNTPGYLPRLRAIPAAKLTPIPPGAPVHEGRDGADPPGAL